MSATKKIKLDAGKLVTTTSQKVDKKFIHHNLTSFINLKLDPKVLVDIIISNDPDFNQVIILGRPEVGGSHTKQMRHTLPYSFTANAIKFGIASSYDKFALVNLIQIMRILILTKVGIYLSDTEYSTFFNSEEIGKNILIEQHLHFISEDGSINYHLILDYPIVNIFKHMYKNNPSFVKQAEDNFKLMFAEYFDLYFAAFTEIIYKENDINVLTIACQCISRLILTFYNQDMFSSFPVEGHTVIEKIAIYNEIEDARNKTKNFTVKFHRQFAKYVKENNNLSEFKGKIRLTNHEGNTIQDCAKLLNTLNKLFMYKTCTIWDVELKPFWFGKKKRFCCL